MPSFSVFLLGLGIGDALRPHFDAGVEFLEVFGFLVEVGLVQHIQYALHGAGDRVFGGELVALE